MLGFIEQRATLVLLLGCVAGLGWPYWGWVSDTMIMVVMIGATFIACFKLKMQEFKQLPWRLLTGFVLVRYVLIAWLAYVIAIEWTSPDIALGILLILALPAGVSAPALTHIYGGQVTLTALMTIATTLLVTLTIPWLFMQTEGAEVIPAPTELIESLVVILVLPCVAYYFLRHIESLRENINITGKALTVLLTAIMLAMVVGKQREFVLADMGMLAQMIVLTFALLCAMLLLGWAAGRRLAYEPRVALAVSSGFNNAALGVALAAFHCGPAVVVIAVGAELAWAALPLVMRMLLKN